MNLTATEILVQLDAIDAQERGLDAQRKVIASGLRELRIKSGMSLRDIAPSLKVTAQTVNNIERGKTWTGKTVRKLAQFYIKHAAV